MKGFLKSLFFIGIITMTAWAQQITEVTGWKMQESSVVGTSTGATISMSTFNASSWYAATVPGTVLSTLVDRGVYSDPYNGTYMTTIPDLASQQKRYWFRSTFSATAAAGQRVWLQIEGINYQASIFVNGDSVGAMLGAFKGAKFDITSSLDPSGTNCLAVWIRGPYTPGAYHTKESGQCGNNGGVMTGDGPTFIASQGWDWVPTVPDRDMGIWKPVYIKVTGPVALRNPWIKTTSVSAASATVPLQVTLLNATGTAVTGTAKANINGTILFTDQPATVPANGSVTVTFPSLAMNNPKLWWPNGYGDPNLYTCNISFTPSTGTVSDTTTFKFGVRQFSYSSTASGLQISCNSQRILVRGGNWGMDDAMKRWDLHKTENKVRYHKEMNFNMLRDWIGMSDNEPFYNFCDEYGIMVWSDFWQPYGPGVSDGPDPSDNNLFEANELDKILRARNHASIAVWCARNETTPNATVYAYLQSIYPTYDGTRYIQSSSGCCGAQSGGPYTYTLPTSSYGNVTQLKTELGSPTVPSAESMSAFLPSNVQLPMGNNTWAFHDYCSGNGNPAAYTTAMANMYGRAPSTLQELCTWAQVINQSEYKSYFEALQSRRFNQATGLLLWMSNCVWPSLMWQTYDYYMEGTGAMYGCQHGAEPIHIMYYGTGTYQVSVINNTMQPISNYSATGVVYNVNGTKGWNASGAVSVTADNANTSIFSSNVTAGSSTPYFLDLKLRDASGNLVSKNFYILPNDGSTNVSSMVTMTKATVAPTSATWTRSGVENTISLKLVNTASVCAVSCRLLLTEGSATGTRILPVHYNDNYFSLIPGDTQNVVIKFDEADRGGQAPKLTLSGINVNSTDCPIGGVVPVSRSVKAEVKAGGLYTAFNGNSLRMYNVASGSAWQLTMFNMQGQTVLEKRGIGNGDVPVISTASLRPGIYVATLRSTSDMFRTMVTISDHGIIR
jgi:hypothetical protein